LAAVQPEMLSYRGIAGRVTTEGGVVRIVRGRERPEDLRPTGEEWARFWSAVDSVDAWRWEASYGREIKDGSPWWLELRYQGRVLATSGNGFEDHAPVGIRRLMLALNQLLGRRLLSSTDVIALQKDYRLSIQVDRRPAERLSEIVLLDRLMQPVIQAVQRHGVILRIEHYLLGPASFGISALLDEPLAAEVIATVHAELKAYHPRLALLQFSSARVTEL
jgi:hypothetical protein